MIRRLLAYLRAIGRRGTERPLPWGGFGLSSPHVEGPRIVALQRRLAARGFTVEATGAYDEQTAAAVAEAKARYRLGGDPERASPDLLDQLGL